jgi:hypothetical protein
MGLFSTHTSSHSHTHSERLVPYEKTVHEHRAVTDASVKLLNEFQEKAIENILHAFKLKDNIIEADGFFIQASHVDYNIEFHCKFKLNSNEYYVKEKIDCFDFRQDIRKYFSDMEYKSAAINLIYKKVSEVIAKELILKNSEMVEAFLSLNI